MRKSCFKNKNKQILVIFRYILDIDYQDAFVGECIKSYNCPAIGGASAVLHSRINSDWSQWAH